MRYLDAADHYEVGRGAYTVVQLVIKNESSTNISSIRARLDLKGKCDDEVNDTHLDYAVSRGDYQLPIVRDNMTDEVGLHAGESLRVNLFIIKHGCREPDSSDKMLVNRVYLPGVETHVGDDFQDKWRIRSELRRGGSVESEVNDTAECFSRLPHQHYAPQAKRLQNIDWQKLQVTVTGGQQSQLVVNLEPSEVFIIGNAPESDVEL